YNDLLKKAVSQKVTVTVAQVPTNLQFPASNAPIHTGDQTQFQVELDDQFDHPIANPSVVWWIDSNSLGNPNDNSIVGNSTVGTATAGAKSGKYSVKATSYAMDAYSTLSIEARPLTPV